MAAVLAGVLTGVLIVAADVTAATAKVAAAADAGLAGRGTGGHRPKPWPAAVWVLAAVADVKGILVCNLTHLVMSPPSVPVNT